ncbi:MAG: glycosyltransferase family 2 protein [Butyrivibrio sp.]|nr:glycosyltransferase family 2 protein [Butyrivibrio sp.]
MEKVSVIIPNYNGKKFLTDCLESLKKQTFRDFRVLIVDNGSTDGSQDFIKNNYPRVTLVALPENTGFANAVNIGIKSCESEYVFLLNDDTVCSEDVLERLVATMDRKKKIFSAQAKLLQFKEPHLIDDAGDLYCALGWAFSPGRDKDNKYFSSIEPVTSACAGAAIYRRELFDEVGLFDPAHFCYLEDVDLGYRARLKGYINVCEPRAIVYHAGSGTSGSRYNRFKVELTAGNNLYFIYKNMPILQIVINLPLILAGILIKHVFYTKRGLGGAHLKGLTLGLSKIRVNADKRVAFGKKEIFNSLRMQLELWINCARKFGAVFL